MVDEKRVVHREVENARGRDAILQESLDGVMHQDRLADSSRAEQEEGTVDTPISNERLEVMVVEPRLPLPIERLHHMGRLPPRVLDGELADDLILGDGLHTKVEGLQSID